MGNKTPDLKLAVRQYRYLIDHLHDRPLPENSEFKSTFNKLFKFRLLGDYQDAYFQFFEENKTNPDISFQIIFYKMQKITGCMHPSFSSKMLAIINPDFPIWDNFVLKNLHLKRPYYGMKDRDKKMIQVYDAICAKYKNHELDEYLDDYKKLTDLDQSISDVKKIDFILWSKRN